MALRFIKRTITSVMSSLLLAACSGGGGGGGAGGNNGGVVAPPINDASFLPVYNFTISDVGTELDWLTIDAIYTADFITDKIITTDFRIEPVVGQYTLATQTVVFENAAIAVETTFGALVIDIIEPLRLEPGQVPNNVSFAVDVALEGRSLVEFIDGNVELVRVNGTPEVIDFATFEALARGGLTFPLWQQQSSVAWAVLDLFRQVITATADSLLLINDDLESTSTVEQFCDTFTGPPPAGALNQGMATLTWLGSGEIANADRFSWEFVSCWLNPPGDRGALLNGRANLDGYSITAGNNVITRIGYESFDSIKGGVFFDNLVFSGTVESSPMTIDLAEEKTYTMSGGLRIIFEQPN